MIFYKNLGDNRDVTVNVAARNFYTNAIDIVVDFQRSQLYSKSGIIFYEISANSTPVTHHSYNDWLYIR